MDFRGRPVCRTRCRLCDLSASSSQPLICLFQIFIADLEEVESLPRHATMAHLERIGPSVCMAYLEHIIHQLGENGSEFHEKLIELYLAAVYPPNHNRKSFKIFSANRYGSQSSFPQPKRTKHTTGCWSFSSLRLHIELIGYWVACPQKICIKFVRYCWVG